MRVRLSVLALALNLLGAVSLFFALELAPSGFHHRAGPVAVIVANRIWLMKLGWLFLIVGFGIQLLLTLTDRRKPPQ